ncbi:MAG TPA: RNA polymerase sigma factor [Bacteroidales bacterium]|nr:RNA polymerase sigma factor [Bacteroidales bacterium]
MTNSTDEMIMNRVKAGNLAELSELFERYNVRIYNFMLKLTFDRSLSQDLTQNLFYRIIKYRHTFKDEFTFKSWIYQLARNIHADHCKKNKKYTEQYTQVEEYDENIIDQNAAFSEDEFARLDQALSRLKPEQKEIIVLSRFQGLKYSEISVIQNQSVPAIKVQVHRAIKQLRYFYFKLI